MTSNRKTRIGILSFAHMHAYSYAAELKLCEDTEIVGIWDADSTRGLSAAVKFASEYYPSLQSLLTSDLDGVLIASENVHHRWLVEAAATAGVKAILCEKPLATTVADAEAMVKAVVESGAKLATAFPCRHSPAFRRLREQVRSGAAGEILAIRGTNRGTVPPGWFTDVTLSGGGAVMDHTPHVADLIWLLLEQDATKIYAESGNEFKKGSFDDTGFLTITYSGGVFATLDTSWSRPKTYPTWGDVTLQVVGTGGVLELDLFGQHLDCYNDTTAQSSWEYWGSSLDGDLIADFVTLCQGGEASDLATGTDGLRAAAITAAAYESIKTSEPAVVG